MDYKFENDLSLEEIGLYATMLNEDGATANNINLMKGMTIMEKTMTKEQALSEIISNIWKRTDI